MVGRQRCYGKQAHKGYVGALIVGHECLLVNISIGTYCDWIDVGCWLGHVADSLVLIKPAGCDRFTLSWV
jgi:hypothetical protein